MKLVKVNKILIGTALATTLFVSGVLPSGINPFEATSVEASTKVTQDNKIMGTSKATAYQMAQFVKNTKGNNIKLKGVTIDQLAQMYIEEGNKEGVRGDVAFAQSILETGYFTFEGSSVTPDQHNYAGIGTTGGGVKGHYFNNARTGVLAQIQHLKAYASKEALNEKNVDPRFKYVTRGIAPTLQDLQGRWAMKKGENYGDVILRIYNKILEVPNKSTATVTTPKKPAVSSAKVNKVSTVSSTAKATSKYTTTSNLNMRVKAGASGKYITTIPKGTSITSKKTQKVGSTTWHYVTVGKNTGWVSGTYLKAQATKSVAKAATTTKTVAKATGKSLVTKANLNVRATAGTKGKYLTTFAKGTKVTSTKTQKVGSTTWHYVTNGKSNGWVSGAYLA